MYLSLVTIKKEENTMSWGLLQTRSVWQSSLLITLVMLFAITIIFKLINYIRPSYQNNLNCRLLLAIASIIFTIWILLSLGFNWNRLPDVDYLAVVSAFTIFIYTIFMLVIAVISICTLNNSFDSSNSLLKTGSMLSIALVICCIVS